MNVSQAATPARPRDASRARPLPGYSRGNTEKQPWHATCQGKGETIHQEFFMASARLKFGFIIVVSKIIGALVAATLFHSAGCTDNSARLTELCGNGTCDDNEDAFTCTGDCSTCGDGVCGPDENKASCMIDCDACALGCDDGDPCTEDVCAAGGCVNTTVDFRIDGCVDGEHYLGCHDGEFGTHSAP
jgi:hypothetical protein